MRILILSQYYPPETGAPQNRLHGLATRLKAKGADVEVLTAMPNYPVMEIQAAYKGAMYRHEEIDGIPVKRSWIYVSKRRGIVSRLLNYFSFVCSSLIIGLFRVKRKDIILCESPPLFLGMSAFVLKIFKAKHLVFNVSDLWPESAEKLGLVTNQTLLGMARSLEEFLYRRSSIVTGQTQGIVDDIKARFPKKPVYWLPNGVDLSYYHPEATDGDAWRRSMGFTSDQVLFFYGGIIGHAQGLEIILQAAERLKSMPEIQFILLGDGPEREGLLQMKDRLGLTHVHFKEAVPKSSMPEILSAVDVAVVPLKKLSIFLGAIPSKIFEALAMEVPLILGVDGEARRHFVEQGGCAIYSEPECLESMVRAVETYAGDALLRRRHGQAGRDYVAAHFTRDAIVQTFVNQLNTLDVNESD